ncbi:MAG: hypothetical protein LBR46_01875 [Prevotella sp.]|jgi:hypothetical protein|nr:hypothetical protein [Prevotella sp.]
MVTIINYKEVQTEDGRHFVSIELQGEPRLEQSSTTGNFYLTANKTRVSTALPIEACKMLIGQTMSGTVEKVQVEPYPYVNKETGESFTLDYAYVYRPEERAMSKEELDYARMMNFNQFPSNHSVIGGSMDISKVMMPS